MCTVQDTLDLCAKKKKKPEIFSEKLVRYYISPDISLC